MGLVTGLLAIQHAYTLSSCVDSVLDVLFPSSNRLLLGPPNWMTRGRDRTQFTAGRLEEWFLGTLHYALSLCQSPM